MVLKCSEIELTESQVQDLRTIEDIVGVVDVVDICKVAIDSYINSFKGGSPVLVPRTAKLTWNNGDTESVKVLDDCTMLGHDYYRVYSKNHGIIKVPKGHITF